MLNWIRSLSYSLLVIFMIPAQADLEICKQILMPSAHPFFSDVGYEIEISISHAAKIARLVEPIYGYRNLKYGYQVTPQRRLGFIPSRYLDPFENLTLDQQGQLLRAMEVRTNGAKTMMDLQLRRTLPLRFSQPTVFLGQVYAPATYEVRLGDIFEPGIENMNPYQKRLAGVELHIRNNLPAGILLPSVDLLLRRLDIQKAGLHAHVVGKTPSRETILGAMEFLRRVNILGEIRTVLGGMDLTPEIEDGNTHFDILMAGDFKVIQHYLLYGGNLPHELFKHIAVAAARFGIYNQSNQGQWGIELRYGHRQDMWSQMADDVDLIRQTVQNGDYGKLQTDLFAWAKTRDPEAGSRFDGAYEVYEDFLYKSFFPSRGMLAIESFFIRHRWATDPILYGHDQNSQTAAAAAHLTALREKYMAALRTASKAQAFQLVRDFLVESDLLNILLRSLSPT